MCSQLFVLNWEERQFCVCFIVFHLCLSMLQLSRLSAEEGALPESWACAPKHDLLQVQPHEMYVGL